MNEIKHDTAENKDNKNIQGTQTNQFSPLADNREYIPNIQQDFPAGKEDKSSSFTKRIKKGAGFFIVVGILALIGVISTSTYTTTDKSPEAQEALNTHISTKLAAGTKLLDKDDNYAGGDLTVEHTSNSEETSLYIWDYAAEDGDYVQVLVNGTPLGDPFMIKNKPVSFKVPTVGEVKVIGTRDGGGGITYAVYYDMNHTTYFNGVDEGGNNTYTLVRK